MRSASVGKKSGEGVVQDERGYTCKNIGCSESFKWRAQLQRHLKGCSFPPPLDTKKYVKLADKSFQCKTCGHNEKHQPNILRHLKFYCGKVKRKKLFKCSDCQKEFPYNSLLLKHIEVHEKTKAKTCDKCKQTFRRSDHFLSHQQKGCYSSVDFTKNCFADVSASMCLSDIYDIDIEPSYDLNSTPDEISDFLDDTCMNDDNIDLHDLESTPLVISTPPSSPVDNQPSTSMCVTPSKFMDITSSTLNVNSQQNILQDKENHTPRTEYFKQFKETSRKTNRLENIIQKLSSPVKKQVKEKISGVSVNDKKISSSVIEHLKTLNRNKNFPQFHKFLHEVFGELCNDEVFIKWIAAQLNIKHVGRLKQSMNTYKFTNFHDNRGRCSIPTDMQQKVYNFWISNSISSTDKRNIISISKRKFLERFSTELTITDTDIVIEEKLNKRGTMHYHTNRRIVTCTVRTLQKKLEEISINLSLGSILSLKPFFIAYPTDREMSLCMCKLCLNARLYFRPLMAKARKDEDESTESITGFLMGTSTCPNTEIGYHSWDCVRGKCKNCKKITPSQLKCSTSEETLNVFQFIATETKYQKISQDGTVTDKVSKKTQKIPETISYKELYSRIVKLKRQYLVHRYQVCNDYFHWKIILDATQFGPIYHLDYSENITQLHREEAQSSHFNKNQYSLHCSVQHNSENNEYFYHLSDVKKHDFAYTSLVVENLISQKPSELIRVKSDNCSTQYKCRWVFNMWRNLAVSVGKIIITYYGTSGHGKGLVDAMSGFGVKGPLKTAVLLDKFSYNTAQDISNMLTEHFENDPNKHYSLITGTEIAHQRTKRISLPIKDCQKLHMIAYFPDGTITSKINLCSCPKCLVGLFTECPYELGTINYSANVDVYDEEDSDNDSDEDDYDEDYDEESYEDDEWEEFEMRGDVIMEIVEPGTVIALFSPKDANELFFLFRVIDLGFASHDMKDKSNHLIVSGEKYIRGNYLEKISEKKGRIYYKLIKDEVLAQPFQIICPLVLVDKNLSLAANLYCEILDIAGRRC